MESHILQRILATSNGRNNPVVEILRQKFHPSKYHENGSVYAVLLTVIEAVAAMASIYVDDMRSKAKKTVSNSSALMVFLHGLTMLERSQIAWVLSSPWRPMTEAVSGRLRVGTLALRTGSFTAPTTNAILKICTDAHKNLR